MGTEAKATKSEPETLPVPRLNVVAAAKILGLDPATVYRLCAARKIRHRRVGVGAGRIVFDPADLTAYLDSCVVEVGEPVGDDGIPALKHLSLEPKGRRAPKP